MTVKSARPRASQRGLNLPAVDPWAAIRGPLSSSRTNCPQSMPIARDPCPQEADPLARCPRAAFYGPRSAVRCVRPGPPDIGSNVVLRGSCAVSQNPRAPARLTGAGAMFLSNIHDYFSTSFNCLI